MESLNQIELIGRIGNARIQNVGGTSMVQFSVATDYMYTSTDGYPVVETTWHHVTAWEGKNIPDLSKFEKGAPVHVVGRHRCQRYIDASGNDRVTYTVVAQTVEIE